MQDVGIEWLTVSGNSTICLYLQVILLTIGPTPRACTKSEKSLGGRWGFMRSKNAMRPDKKRTCDHATYGFSYSEHFITSRLIPDSHTRLKVADILNIIQVSISVLLDIKAFNWRFALVSTNLIYSGYAEHTWSPHATIWFITQWYPFTRSSTTLVGCGSRNGFPERVPVLEEMDWDRTKTSEGTVATRVIDGLAGRTRAR